MNEEITTMKTLIERAKAGEQNAYTELYNATNQEVYQIIRSMVRDEHLALDIQQEVYVRAFNHLDQLEDPEKFPSWLRTTTVNMTRNELRKQKPILFSELVREDGSDVPEFSDLRPENYPEVQVDQKETSHLVQEILDTLTDSQRLLVGMYYYEQIPVTKIAEDLGVSPGTVKTQLSRSRRKIENRIKELEEKGIKLYGLNPIPFLLMLFKRLKPGTKAGEKVLTGALSESGLAETAVLHVSRGFFHTFVGRVTVILVSVAVIGGGVAALRWFGNRRAELPIGDVQMLESVSATDALETKEDPAISTDPVSTAEEADIIVTETVPSEEASTEPQEPSDPDPNNPTDPEPTNPEPTVPEPTHPSVPGPSDPEPTTAKPTNSEPMDPEPMDPEPTDPEPTDPEPTDPEPTDPEPTDPEPTDPKPMDPEPTDPEPTDPEPTDPEPTDPVLTDPEPSDPEPSQPLDSEPSDGQPEDPQPTDPDPSATEKTACRIVSWDISGNSVSKPESDESYEVSVGSTVRLEIRYFGEADPIVYSDDVSVLKISNCINDFLGFSEESGEREFRLTCELCPIGAGTGCLRCEFAEQTAFTVSVIVLSAETDDAEKG